jgi:hypothetical protein
MHTSTRNEYIKLTGQSKVSVGFEALIAAVMKSNVFWDITPYSPLKVKDVSEEHYSTSVKA